MLSGDAAAVRQPPGVSADEARHPVAACSWRRSSQKTRRRTKSLTRALPLGRPSGGGAQPPPPELPASAGVDQRSVIPRPDRGLPPPQPLFRFWVDELLWSQGRVAVELMEAVLTEAGGLRTGGPSRQQERARRRRLEMEAQGLAAVATPGPPPYPGPCLGSQHTDSWEVLWTKSTYAIPAARSMRPGQLVSAIIGLNSLTMKKRLMLTLRDALGPDAAFAITPRSFALPEELDQWVEWLRRQQQQQQRGEGAGTQQKPQQKRKPQGRRGEGAEQGSGDEGLGSSLWILKTGQDAGKGLSLLPADQAVRYARQQLQHQRQADDGGVTGGDDGGGGGGRLSNNGGGGGPGPRRFQLQVAQQYIADPFLIDGRKFHLRLWLLVTAHSPLRAHLHRRGLVLFSSELYDKDAAETAPLGGGGAGGSTARAAVTAAFSPPAGHVTNYARNENTQVWSMRQLAEHLGERRFGELWARLCGACGAALAAAAPSLAEAHAWLRPTVHEYGFQVLGVDFLLDERLWPWLLECNSAPSIMVQHECEEMRALVYEQKYGMLRDTWEIVRGRVYAPGEERQKGVAGGPGGAARWEAEHSGEYEPLMPYI